MHHGVCTEPDKTYKNDETLLAYEDYVLRLKASEHLVNKPRSKC